MNMIQPFFIFIYNISIRMYALGVRIASLFNPKARKWVSGRKDWKSGLQKNIPEKGVGIWIHCASLGEFEQGRPVIEALRKGNPQLFILLTFFSPSGYEVRKNYAGANLVCYLPLDTRRNAQHFLKIIKPGLTFFVKYEFWYHFLNQLQQQKYPVFLISGIFRKNQFFFKKYDNPFKKLLTGYTHLFVQDKKSAELLKAVGINDFTVTGDTRFDRVLQPSHATKALPEIGAFLVGKECWVAGSSWPPDEKLIKESLDLVPKWIIAPHEISSAHLKEIEKLFPDQTIRHSALIQNPTKGQHFSILIIDNIGMLASVYKLGKVAYIGGGFGQGIHNILEAAVHNMPVVFGPRYHKFEEAKALIAIGAAFTINNKMEFRAITKQLSETSFQEQAGRKAGQYVQEQSGATDAIISYLQEKRFLIKS